MNILNFPNLNSEAYCKNFINGCGNAINVYLMTYKLPEDLIITPSTVKQYYEPSAKNRYIRSVTVKANS